MKRVRIGFLLPGYSSESKSNMPRAMRALSDRGAIVDVIHPSPRVVDLSTLRVENDLYVLKKISDFTLSIAGALHAQGPRVRIHLRPPARRDTSSSVATSCGPRVRTRAPH